MNRLLRPLLARNRPVAPHRRVGGRAGLVIGLHGYGSDRHQLDTLLPLHLPVITVQPQGRHRVEPGWGWWTPEIDPVTGLAELAPPVGVDQAVAEVSEVIRSSQEAEGIGPEHTALIGYSQGATLALSVAARRPELVSVVATGAGFLLPDERPRFTPDRPLDVLIMNGTLDPLIGAAEHHRTVERFAQAGHQVVERLDPVPHVIDRSQVPLVNQIVGQTLASSASGAEFGAQR